jgi:hypothetical protein
MKINQIGIQSYQQVNRQDQQNADQRRITTQDSTVNIDPKSQPASSALAVKATSGNLMDSLSGDERKALEMLFSRFRDSGRFGNNYRPNADAKSEDSMLGQIVDVKV